MTDPHVIIDSATPDDCDAIVALIESTLGAAEAPSVRAWFRNTIHLPDRWMVVRNASDASDASDSRSTIVAVAACLPAPMRFGSRSLAASRIEFVATRPGHRGLGHATELVTRLLAASDRRGDLVQIADGIPYYYRSLGFGYAVDPPTVVDLTGSLPAIDPAPIAMNGTGPTVVRTAKADDSAALDRLIEESSNSFDVVAEPRPWGVWFEAAAAADAHDFLLIAEQGLIIVGFARAHLDHNNIMRVQSSFSTSPEAARVLHERLRSIGRGAVLALDSGSPVWRRHLGEHGDATALPFGICLRIADHEAFLKSIRSELDTRLAVTRTAVPDQVVRLSMFTSSVFIEIADGKVADIRSAASISDPVASGDVGIAPDWFPALAFGRWGATVLGQRVDDVILGDHAELLEILFPPLFVDSLVDL